MAVKPLIVAGLASSQLGCHNLRTRHHHAFGLIWENQLKRTHNWVFLGGVSVGRAMRLVENENPRKPAKILVHVVDHDQTGGDVSHGLHKDLLSLPRPLSISDIMASSDDGAKVRISYKGIPGSYSEDAALKAYPKCETVPCNDFEDAFKAVEIWWADKVIIPIENTSGGSIHRNYDLLLRHRLHIVGEVQLATNLSLLALPGVRAEHLKRVLSHSQALELSDNFLTKLGVARENVDDTAGAAQHVASNGLYDAGAIASVRAAEIYGLDVLAERIQDDSEIISRYLVLARDPIIPKANKLFKTSIVFTLDEGPGMLFKALAVFALRDINLSKIESRPQRNRPLRVVDDFNTGTAKYFDYLFYIDFEASMTEPRSQTALAHLQEFATFLRVLGCYPIDTTI
ncbi:arogenate dehydratase/prephenate dehydratase 1, chloroplastic-like [Gastrolobium bilobum]|uniref:arogenate dehydratase/prephenate dehydratase 1, chloroplastic-like n=1 Tax=Gastrolobium bilobum TaxID=150636 RepID=UPI002AB0AE23|nr:arogenate dehydratase/prephenate dehydratase 1, chloroplastic-like [Gastrolobium bilobum]XP_061350624.1 arogenate dehydratase/prephenate dehydratase 1, chloroplastic-like [Gastrolobium bilobum]